MMETLGGGSKIGGGIYTLPDIGLILGIPYHKVHRYVNEYWDNKLAWDLQGTYSWHDGKSRAIGFHTLIEMVVFLQLSDAGVKSKTILQAHDELSERFDTVYPFANSRVVKNMATDSLKIYFKENNEQIFSLDGKKQLNLKFIIEFFKNIDFGEDQLASKFWPMGKKNSIVVDPNHQCGQPVIDGTNITPDAIYNMYKAGEKPKFIAYLYDLKPKEVKNALEFCDKSAA